MVEEKTEDVPGGEPESGGKFARGRRWVSRRNAMYVALGLLAAMLLIRFDVRPAAGEWVVPSTAKSSQAEAVEQPDEDVEVVFVPRPEVAGKTWRVEFSGRRDAELLVQK